MSLFDHLKSQKTCKIWLDYNYPLTVIRDRYDGCYSGALYTAWPIDYYEVPREVDGSDPECATFWDDADTNFIGLGYDVQTAVNNLIEKMKKNLKP